jgi:chorismate synthase
VLNFKTAGESHGPGLVILVENLPAGLPVDKEKIDAELARRQRGYGRGGRMAIETDKAEIISGIRWGRTTGAPVAMIIKNRDFENWREAMSFDRRHENSIAALTEVRPGHADLSGALKYGHTDARNILERSSARETAGRVAAGALAKALLEFFEIKTGSFVTSIGPAVAGWSEPEMAAHHLAAESSVLRMADPSAEKEAIDVIDGAKSRGDTVGGTFICFATGLPVGLGSHVSWDQRIEGRIGMAMLSIPAVKAVEFGIGFENGSLPGSSVHDEIIPGGVGDIRRGMVRRKTNRAGGIEGGMTNGETLWLRAAMKPIPTLMKPLGTVDLLTGEPVLASRERSDVCAVPAASVVGEAMLAMELAKAFSLKFGGDSVDEMGSNFSSYLEALGRRWKKD